MFFGLLLIGCTHSTEETADMILTNAQVFTVNKDQPMTEAVAVKGDRILFTGSALEAADFIGSSTRVIDCKGQFLMPGFIEGHGHIHGLGESLSSLDLMHTHSWEDIVTQVAAVVQKAKPGEWIYGRGWHQEKWDSVPQKNFLGYPYHEALDKISPNNPVLLEHASGHSCYVNAKAMEEAGVGQETKSPEGGEIVRDSRGGILGVFAENAQNLIYRAYNDWRNKMTEAEKKAYWIRWIDLAEKDCLRKGITSFQDAGSSFTQVAWMKELAEQNKLQIRHWLMVRENHQSLRLHQEMLPIIGAGNGFLTVKAVKVALDGALGSYGAWLLEPYSDRPGWTGENTIPLDSLRSIAGFCWDHGLQLCVHAIGDRANRETINLFAEQIQKEKNRDHRWRVEHAQHVNPVEIPRFGEWKVIASMQAIHCTSDAPFVEKRLGPERAASGAYMWKAFMNAGVVVTNGTDAPVEDEDPIACYYAAVTRKGKDGTAFYPAQKMSREEALNAYTLSNAYAAFEEKDKGSIEKGKLADLVLLSNNLLTCPESEIRNTHVMMTIVGGKIKYQP